MGTQTDVKSTRLAASGSVHGARTRVKGIYYVAGAGAGSIVIRDGGASGTALITIDTPAGATLTRYLQLPGEGVLCETDAYATLTDVTAATIFWG